MKPFGSLLQAAPAARAPAALARGRITRPCMAPRTFARTFPKVVCVAAEAQAAAEKRGVTNQPTAPVTFKVFLRINYGEHLRVVGSSEALGGWEVDKAPQMVWNEGHIWSATVDLPVGEQFEFKFVHVMPVRAPVWEATSNRNFKISDTRLQAISTQWNNPMAEYEARAVAVQDAGALELLESPSFSATVSVPAPAEAAPSTAALPQQQEGQHQQPEAPNSPATEAAATPALGNSTPASQMFEEGANYDADVESMFESLEDVTSALTGSLAPSKDSPAADASAALVPVQPEAQASAAQVPASQPEAGPEGSAAAAAAAQPAPAGPSKDAGSLLKTVGRTAGYVAMGVAAGALFSALAVDITEVAVMGAVVAAAGSAALSNGSSTGSKEEGKEGKKKKAALAAEGGTASVVDVEAEVVAEAGEGGSSSSGAVLEVGSAEEDEEEGESESDGEVDVGAVGAKGEPSSVEVRRSRPKGSEPAVIMAAAVLHALDSANTVLSSVILSSVSDGEKGSDDEKSKQ